MVRRMNRGREPMDDGPALEELFASLPVTADWTMGFLTAVCTGPDPIAPAEWLPPIVGEVAIDEDPRSRARFDLLARLYGAVAETLAGKPEIIPPEPDKPAEEAFEFCRGYLHGARMHATWAKDEAAAAKLFPFAVLAKELTDADADEATHRQALGSHVADLRGYWQSKRQVVHVTPKVGRNDPCPCGSGKKHKKCCLARSA
ncbi:MAG: yecA family protein [Labilithrix sp.]|nr:yecA family protein [Labilithrix sp.]